MHLAWKSSHKCSFFSTVVSWASSSRLEEVQLDIIIYDIYINILDFSFLDLLYLCFGFWQLCHDPGRQDGRKCSSTSLWRLREPIGWIFGDKWCPCTTAVVDDWLLWCALCFIISPLSWCLWIVKACLIFVTRLFSPVKYTKMCVKLQQKRQKLAKISHNWPEFRVLCAKQDTKLYEIHRRHLWPLWQILAMILSLSFATHCHCHLIVHVYRHYQLMMSALLMDVDLQLEEFRRLRRQIFIIQIKIFGRSIYKL